MAVTTPRSAVSSAARYLAARFPLHTHGAGVLSAYLCSLVLYSAAAGHRLPVGPWLAAGAVTVLLLFLQLRFVDDISDLRHDIPPDAAGGPVRLRRQRRLLVGGLAATIPATACLNLAWPPAMLTALAATTLAVLTPSVIKRLVRENSMLLAPGYEGGPAIALVYIYLLWTAATGYRVPSAAVAGVVGMFWAAYEFWKFSRKVHRDAYQPYSLGDRGLRIVLTCLLGLAAGCAVLLRSQAAVPAAFVACGVGVPVAFAVWLNLSWSRAAWSGLAFAAALVLAVLITTRHALPSP